MYLQTYAPDQTFPTLRSALEALTVSDLKEIAGLLTKTAKPTRKDALVTLIENAFAEENLPGLWSRLDTVQQAALSEVVHASGSAFDPTAFRAKYGKDPDWGTSTGRWGTAVEPSLLSTFFYGRILPEDLKARLKTFVPPPPKIELVSLQDLPPTYTETYKHYNYGSRKAEERTQELPITSREMQLPALHELLTLLRLVDAGKVAVSDKTFLPSATATKAINAVLEGGDYYDNTAEELEEDDESIGPIRALSWPLLLQAGKLAGLSGKRLALTPAGQKALSAPLADTLRVLWRTWMKTTLFDELRRINAIRGQTGKGKNGLTAASRRREVIATALKECPIQRWVRLQDFLRYMRASHYDFEVTRNLWTLYIDDPNYGGLGQGGDTWPVLQGRYIRCLLFEYAATLGMVDVAYTSPADVHADYSGFWGTDDLSFLSRYDGLLYFRLNPLGAYCLGLTETYMPPKAEQREAESILRVLPNMDVVITATSYSRGDTLLLDLYTQKSSERVWRLEQSKMLSALEEGHPVTELREFLEAHSAEPLPATVQQFLRDFEMRAERLHDKGDARLIACSDPTLLQLITHDPRTRKLCMSAGDSHFVVPVESLPAFRKALRQLGYVIPPRGDNMRAIK